jgi:hypothetical protein
MADDVRDKAQEWLDRNVPAGMAIYSDGATAGRFTQITGLTQDGLVTQWKSQEAKPLNERHCVTSCNSFAGEFSRAVYKQYLGGIDPHDVIKKLKKDYAWVVASDDVRPKKGDIVKSKGQHVFVSLDFDGNGKWNIVQGGQGGPTWEKGIRSVRHSASILRALAEESSRFLRPFLASGSLSEYERSACDP